MYDQTEDALRGTTADPRFAGSEVAAEPQQEVPHAVNRLEQANSQLHEVTKVLHERLASVRNEHSNKEAADQAVRGYSSELARRIGEQADRTEMATAVIVKILNELEV